MPYTVSITADEAHLLTEAKVDGVEGTIFTYAPGDSLEIIEIVAQLTPPETLGLQRLSDRLQTLYGTFLAAVARKRESEQANDDLVFGTVSTPGVYINAESEEVPSPPPATEPAPTARRSQSRK
jgi:hypothetical protein